METTQIQNASSTGTAPTSTTSPTSKTNTESTNAGSTTDTKGKQPQVFASRKRNAEDRKNHKFGITLQKPLELNVIIVENIMHVILLLICGVI